MCEFLAYVCHKFAHCCILSILKTIQPLVCFGFVFLDAINDLFSWIKKKIDLELDLPTRIEFAEYPMIPQIPLLGMMLCFHPSILC